MKRSYEIPKEIVEKAGKLEEFRQDASIVSVELDSGEVYGNIVLLYPNTIIGMESFADLPFDIRQVAKVFQTNEDKKTRSASSWNFWI